VSGRSTDSPWWWSHSSPKQVWEIEKSEDPAEKLRRVGGGSLSPPGPQQGKTLFMTPGGPDRFQWLSEAGGVGFSPASAAAVSGEGTQRAAASARQGPSLQKMLSRT